MKNKKIVMVIPILAIGIPLFAIGTQIILKKVREDYYKTQKQQIEIENAREREEKEQKLTLEKSEREKQLQIKKKNNENEKNKIYLAEGKNETKQKIVEPKIQEKTDKKEKVEIASAAPVFTPEPEVTVTEKHELTPEEIKKARKALKEARASYFSGSKIAKPSKDQKNTDKIAIKSDSKENAEAAKRAKKENEKAQRILKEIRDSYYKNSTR